jgi:beta-glucosidase
MCGYNSFEGKPCCGSSELLGDILRKKWKFEGLVISDCGAINDFLSEGHNVDKDNSSAASDAVIHGIFFYLNFITIN